MDADVTPVLFYDASCALCVQLAMLVERRAQGKLRVQPWELLIGEAKPDGIGLWHEAKLSVGAAAFAVLLELHPDCKDFAWLLEKGGLRQAAAKGLQYGSGLLRRLCLRCR